VALDWATVKGGVSLNGASVEGSVSLNEARVEGNALLGPMWLIGNLGNLSLARAEFTRPVSLTVIAKRVELSGARLLVLQG
jgi:hypothetical protein